MKSVKISQNVGGTVNHWAEALKKAGKIKLADKLMEDETIKLKGLKKLEDLDLPRLKRITVPLKTFLASPKKYFKTLGSSTFHVSLLSPIETKRRIRLFPLTSSQVLKVISEKVTPAEITKFTLTMSQFYENAYGGNVVINDHGKVVLELVEGIHLNLVMGSQTPIVTGARDYYFEPIEFFSDLQRQKPLTNTKLRKLLNEVVNLIDGRPGYYEFVFGYEKKNPSRLFPIFIDFRDQPWYLELA